VQQRYQHRIENEFPAQPHRAAPFSPCLLIFGALSPRRKRSFAARKAAAMTHVILQQFAKKWQTNDNRGP
jgi:hypothetical protein